jgi:hypothetical protein
MMREQEILAALRALAESDREKEAPPELEARLRQAFRQRRISFRQRRIFRTAAAWALAAAAAVAIVLMWPTHPEPVHQAEIVRPVAPVQQILPVTSEPVRKPAHVRRAPHREIVTEFFPLMDIAPPFERGELVRVNLPASAMRTLGLPVREDRLTDRVEADVLVSEEGLARAIRFVKLSQ